MKKRKSESNEITCIFCNHYKYAKIIYSDSQGNVRKQCKETRKEINYLTEACSMFEPTMYFPCIKDNARLNIKVCKNRECNCWQGDIINQILERNEDEG